MGSDQKNFPGTAQTDRQTDTTIALIYKIDERDCGFEWMIFTMGKKNEPEIANGPNC